MYRLWFCVFEYKDILYNPSDDTPDNETHTKTPYMLQSRDLVAIAVPTQPASMVNHINCKSSNISPNASSCYEAAAPVEG
jgi:hypothetical protein